MNEKQTNTGQAQVQSGAGCCSSPTEDAAGKTEECPCGSIMKKHKFACIVFLSIVVLTFLISQVGGILGMIGFARTF